MVAVACCLILGSSSKLTLLVNDALYTGLVSLHCRTAVHDAKLLRTNTTVNHLLCLHNLPLRTIIHSVRVNLSYCRRLLQLGFVSSVSFDENATLSR